MVLSDFDSWNAFKVDKSYARNCQQFSTQWGCSAEDDVTDVTRIGDSNSYNGYRFRFQPNAESLFYYLVERDGFDRVDWKQSHFTYTYNANDNDGHYDFREHSISDSEQAIFRRKINFPLGHIQTKLSQIQIDTINQFTLQKIENINVSGMYYKFIVNNQHIMSVNKYQTDLFFQIIEKDFYTTDRIHYRRK
jgi:hypothetical protein